MSIVTFQKELEGIISKHQDLIGSEAKNLQQEYAIDSADKTEEAIETIAGENRLLQIGILGRVKAGKSSLINALLFDGKSILPKAATPMTAALTIISYGEELSAEVEFFKQEDIENIQREAANVEKGIEQIVQRKYRKLEKDLVKDLEKKRTVKLEMNKIFLNPEQKKKLTLEAEEKAKQELKNKYPSYDQWEKIDASGIDFKNLHEFETLKGDTLENLSQSLLEYVGAEGKYMPFTKSVHIKIPQENLKGIQIVDTPGVNDPVQSREERTRELLKYCDVVFIVSPSGQFMASEDLDLMDRITSKEGIRELYVLASKVDDTFCNASIFKNANGDLQQAFKAISNDLTMHLHSTLINLKEMNPEVGDAYDSLINQSKEKIIHSSGICLTIKESFSQRELWNEGVKKAWENLTTHYPDYFSDTDETLSLASLDMLANIGTIHSIVEDVKEQKATILKKRKKEFVEAKQKSLIAYRESLLSYIDTRIDEISNGNIDTLKEEQQKLKKMKNDVSAALDEEYYEIVDGLETDIDDTLNDKLKSHFREAKSGINTAEDSKVVSSTYDYGFWSWKFGSSRYERTYEDVTTVRAGAVIDALTNLTQDIEKSIKNTAKIFIRDWKKKLKQDLVRVLRENIDDKDINVTQIKKVLRIAINKIKYPEMSYSGEIPSNLSGSGTLEGDRAEIYIDNVREYVSSLHGRVTKDIKEFLSELIGSLNNIKMAESVFGNYDEMLRELEEQIDNKELVLEKLDRVKIELLKTVN